jgi:DHA1 family tetracycline resistance protein-like MFS transporter
LLSRITPESEQGAVFGTLNSVQTLARMISYSVSNILLGRVSTAAPYWGAFGIDLLALTAAGHIAMNVDQYSPPPSGKESLVTSH